MMDNRAIEEYNREIALWEEMFEAHAELYFPISEDDKALYHRLIEERDALLQKCDPRNV